MNIFNIGFLLTSFQPIGRHVIDDVIVFVSRYDHAPQKQRCGLLVSVRNGSMMALRMRTERRGRRPSWAEAMRRLTRRRLVDRWRLPVARLRGRVFSDRRVGSLPLEVPAAWWWLGWGRPWSILAVKCVLRSGPTTTAGFRNRQLLRRLQN